MDNHAILSTMPLVLPTHTRSITVTIYHLITKRWKTQNIVISVYITVCECGGTLLKTKGNNKCTPLRKDLAIYLFFGDLVPLLHCMVFCQYDYLYTVKRKMYTMLKGKFILKQLYRYFNNFHV